MAREPFEEPDDVPSVMKYSGGAILGFATWAGIAGAAFGEAKAEFSPGGGARFGEEKVKVAPGGASPDPGPVAEPMFGELKLKVGAEGPVKLKSAAGGEP